MTDKEEYMVCVHKSTREICKAFMIEFDKKLPEWFFKAIESGNISVHITHIFDSIPYAEWSIRDIDTEIYTGGSGDYVLGYTDGSIGIVNGEIFEKVFEPVGNEV